MQIQKKCTCFSQFVSIKLSILFVLFPALEICAQKPLNLFLEMKNSEISFFGDDSFISERYVLTPFPYGRIWVERLKIKGGGAMVLEELDPGFRYGITDSDPKVNLPKIFNSTQASFGARIKLAKSDIRSGENGYGNFYYAVKSNETASCGVAQQISGDTQDVKNGPSLGDKSFSIIMCRPHGDIEIEKFFFEVFANVRFDEGAINKVKASGRCRMPKASNSEPITNQIIPISDRNKTPTPTHPAHDHPSGLKTELLRLLKQTPDPTHFRQQQRQKR